MGGGGGEEMGKGRVGVMLYWSWLGGWVGWDGVYLVQSSQGGQVGPGGGVVSCLGPGWRGGQDRIGMGQSGDRAGIPCSGRGWGGAQARDGAGVGWGTLSWGGWGGAAACPGPGSGTPPR